MAASVIYSSIFGAVLASLPALSTRFVVFDTAVFACTPDAFPDLMAAALSGKDIHLWAKGQAIATAKD